MRVTPTRRPTNRVAWQCRQISAAVAAAQRGHVEAGVVASTTSGRSARSGRRCRTHAGEEAGPALAVEHAHRPFAPVDHAGAGMVGERIGEAGPPRRPRRAGRRPRRSASRRARRPGRRAGTAAVGPDRLERRRRRRRSVTAARRHGAPRSSATSRAFHVGDALFLQRLVAVVEHDDRGEVRHGRPARRARPPTTTQRAARAASQARVRSASGSVGRAARASGARRARAARARLRRAGRVGHDDDRRSLLRDQAGDDRSARSPGGQATHATDARRAASSPPSSGAGGDACTAGSGAASGPRFGGDADRSSSGARPGPAPRGPVGTGRRRRPAGPPTHHLEPAAAGPPASLGLDVVGDDPAPHPPAVERHAHDRADTRPARASASGTT